MNRSQIDVSEKEPIGFNAFHQEEDFAVLYDNYSAVLYGLSLKIVVSETIANEVLQKAFLKIWKNFSEFDTTKDRLLTWMINITRKTALESNKLMGNPQNSLFSSKNDLRSDSATSAVKITNPESIKMLNLLDSKSKQVIDSVYINGYALSETAELLNLPVETIKLHVKNGMTELRKAIK